ncbi:multifunctional CCA addition/repair protein [Candidatus Hamiltonella defensa]|uniref:CCA-adding enzyme n=1 Tax=Candidatus Williamhamiltonella defendens TaxID=138072 RepID=A0AAC9YFF5_9ENTR|nr:multifunctional CCA addition/repair protein [Candidatus Hamiltonella defensa]ASV33267.1 multifunctional CCA tRNA nucleotidyl transferase/2'3'-cyclic phosphodiesterase/2'nucleotidase/phosphatase [Candidatus Hamiltonella defensa]AWK16229.1 multifunctional CCA tRNA nucleotidyl transferase/2'3'-cyclic phosphodiesterase/2'nucleotidase/phosphatase [Candidatus Hamiltonella defensa]MBK4361553.1 multifunctional CCA addition/repair protein [Candidatus Hamiltonella defensa]
MNVYLVGGAVRNRLLKLPVTERDWVVVGATPEEMLLLGYKKVGKNFPVFLHPETKEEYALARTERKMAEGHTGFACYASPDVTLEEDLLRRDLTINAIACNDKGDLIDPYQGEKDLNQLILRHVSEAFIEDPLRVLRVARFAAQFAHLGFSIDSVTLDLMTKISQSGELLTLSPERVWKETQKALLSPSPHIYFQVLKHCSAILVLFPEIDTLCSPLRCPLSHGLSTLSIAAKLTDQKEVRFAALCHILGKKLTEYDVLGTHDRAVLKRVPLCDLNKIEQLCERLKLPNLFRELLKHTLKYRGLVRIINRLSFPLLLNFFDELDLWRKPYRLEQLILISKADESTEGGVEGKHDYQAQYVREAFNIARAVSVKKILEGGFRKEAIQKELTRRRNQALDQWQKQKT